MSKYYSKTDGVKFEYLFGGPEQNVFNKNVAVKVGAEIKRGMLLAESSDSTVAQATAADIDKPLYIASEDFTSSTDTGVVSTVYVSGRFNRSAIITADGVDIDKFEEALRKENILLTDVKKLKEVE